MKRLALILSAILALPVLAQMTEPSVPLKIGIVLTTTAPTPDVTTCVYGKAPSLYVATAGTFYYCHSTGVYKLSPPPGGGASAAGNDSDVQVRVGGTFGTIAGFTASQSTGEVQTRAINGVKIAKEQSGVSGSGTSASPFTGWCGSALTSGNVRMLFTKNDDGSLAYYDFPDAGCTLSDDTVIEGDGNAIFTWGTAGSSPWGRAAINPGLIIPAGADRVTITGMRFEAGVPMNTLSYCEGSSYTLGATSCTTNADCPLGDNSHCAAYGLRTCAQAPSQAGCGTGGESFIQVGTASNATPATDVLIEGNKFGVMRYKAGADIYTDDPGGADIDLIGAYQRFRFIDNDVDAAPANLSAPFGNCSVQITNSGLEVSRNRFTFSQTYHDFSGLTNLSTGNIVSVQTACSGSPLYETIINDVIENDNTTSNINGAMGIFQPGDGRVISNNSIQSDILDACVWLGRNPGSTKRQKNISITGNKCSSDTTWHASPIRKGVSSPVIEVQFVDSAAIVGNEIYGDSDFGSIYAFNATGVTVSGNSIDIDSSTGGFSKAIAFYGVTVGTISGNTIRNSGMFGISIEDASGVQSSGVSVSGNTIIDTNATAVLNSGITFASTCNGCSVVGNVVSVAAGSPAPLVWFSGTTGASLIGNVGYIGSTLTYIPAYSGSFTGPLTTNDVMANHVAGGQNVTTYNSDGIDVEGATYGLSNPNWRVHFPDAASTTKDVYFTDTSGYVALANVASVADGCAQWSGNQLTTTGSACGSGGGGITDGDKTDITVSGGGTVWNIDADAVGTTEIAADAVTAAKIANDAVGTTEIADGSVSLADMANLAQDQFIVRTTASTGVPQTATVTAFARSYLDDTTQGATQITLGLQPGVNVQAYDIELAGLAALTSAADQLPYYTGSGTAALTTLTSFARTLLDDTNQATMRATLALTPGTDVQAQDTELQAIAGLTSAADRLPYFTGSGTAALATFTAQGRALVDDADAATQRTTLGLVIGTNVEAWDADLDDLADGTLTGSKVEAAGAWAQGSVTTGTQTFAGDKTFNGTLTAGPATDGARGVEMTDNSSECADPASGNTSVCTVGARLRVKDTGTTGIYVTTAADWDTSAEVAANVGDETGSGALVFAGSPALTGDPTVPTAAANDNDTSAASTAYVQQEINGASGTGIACSGGTCALDYTPTLAGNPSLGAGQCVFDSGDGSGAGGILCEMSGANNGEFFLQVPSSTVADRTTVLPAGSSSTAVNIPAIENNQTWTGNQTFNSTTVGKIVNGSYYCGFDWDGDATTTNDAGDIKACLDAAKTAAGSGEAGSDHSVDIYLPDGIFDLSSVGGMCPYTLQGGMQIHGVAPRPKWVAGTGSANRGFPPDYDIQANGGTWLTCGSTYTSTMFTATKTRGLIIEDLGAKNFGIFLDSGGDQIDGVSFSQFINLYLIGVTGNSPSSSIVGFQMYNPQHVYSEHVSGYRLDTLWHIVSQNCDWQPGNSVIVDSYVVNRARNVTDPGIWLEAKSSSSPSGCTEANPNSLNYITFVRPQINGDWVAGGGSALSGSAIVKLQGASSSVGIFGMQFIGMDIEGNAEHGILTVNKVSNSTIDVAATSAQNEDVYFSDGNASYNVVTSTADRLKFYTVATNNFLYGSIDSLTSGSATPQGNWHVRAEDRNYVNTDVLTVTPSNTAVTGAVQKSAIQAQTNWASTDTSNYPEFYGAWVDGALGLNTTNAHANWFAYYANPRTQGSATGNTVVNVVGYAALPQMGSTGTGTSITNFMAYKANLYFNLGSNWAANVLCYFCADDTLADALPTGASANAFYGLHIPNLHAVGSANHSILIDSQSSSASKGNLTMSGGAYDTGHLLLGSTHLWQESAGALAIKSSAPGSAADGSRLVSSSRSSQGGPAAWALASTTCTTACTNIGMANCANGVCISGTGGSCTAIGTAVACSVTDQTRLCECY